MSEREPAERLTEAERVLLDLAAAEVDREGLVSGFDAAHGLAEVKRMYRERVAVGYGDQVVPRACFGRGRELAILRSAFADTTRGVGGCVVVTGSAGIGKSHLLRTAVREARESGLAVATREAFELDRAAPFVTLASALKQIEPVTDAFGWISEASGVRFATIDRLAGTMEDFAATQPLVVAIDDAQWVDEFSALVIRELVTSLASSPVRWLLTRRVVSDGTPGQRVVDGLISSGALEVELSRLDETAVAQLCSEVIGAEADDTVLAVASDWDGNPLALEQLMRALRTTDQLLVHDGTATLTGDQLPSSFIRIVEQTLGGLSRQTRRLLGAGAVLGGRLRVESLAKMLDTRPAALWPLIEEATDAKVLVEQRDVLAFSHDQVRVAVYGTLSDAAKADYHQRAAVIGREEDRSPVEVAEHLLRSGRSTREAVTLLHDAALEVSAAAPSTAADLMMRALGVTGPDDPDRPRLVAETVGLLASAGRLERAQRLGEAALQAGLAPPDEAALLLGLAEAFKHAGRNRMAVDYASRGLSYPDVSEAVRAGLWAVRAHASFYTGDLIGCDRFGSSAYESGMQADEHRAAVFGLTARSLAALAEGRLDDALAHASEATEIADNARGGVAHWHPRIWLGDVLVALDRFDEASDTFRRGREESERLGTAWSTPLWHYYYGALLTASGRIDEAIAETNAGIKAAEGRAAYALAVPLLAALARLHVTRGELLPARACLERMRGWMADGITTAPEDSIWAEGVYQEATAGPRFALRALAPIYDAMPARCLLIVQDPSAAAALVRIALRAGAPERADLVVATARKLADLNPGVRGLAAAAAHAEGVLRQDPDLLGFAIKGYRTTRRVLALASAFEDAADAGTNGAEARQLAQEALAITAASGAERARRRLEARLGLTDPHRLPREIGRAQLSRVELRVATLVAGGRNTREVAEELFLSRHTVDSHLRRIFAKLGVDSRAALARRIVADDGDSASTV